MGDRKHETAHLDQPPTAPAPSSPAAAEPPRPEQVDKLLASGAGVANTSWSINFGTIGREAGKPVTARTPESALYVHDLKVAPDGEPGRPSPAPHHFRGVTLASTGAAHIGTYAHPRDRAGIASAAVSFGGKPSFDFTITSKPQDLKIAPRDHAIVVRALAAELDEFVDDLEAQAALDRVVATHFGTEEVKAVIKRKDRQLGKPVNTSDLKYGQVHGDRSFRLRVDVPTVVKDKSTSWATTANGETLTGEERSQGSSTNLETTTTTTVETQRKTALETALKSGLRGLTKNFVNNGLANERTTFHETGAESQNGSTTKLSGSVGGEINLVPDIPLLGRLVKRLINPKLNVNLSPDFTGMFSLTGTKKDASTSKQSFQHQNGAEVVLESEVENLAKHLASHELRNSIQTALKVVVGSAEGEKQSGSRKQSSMTSTSTTVGSVQVLATSVQANLVEE